MKVTLLISGATLVVVCQSNDSKRTLLATFLLTAMWSQAAFDPSKAVADVVLAEDLNSLRISLSEAGYEGQVSKATDGRGLWLS